MLLHLEEEKISSRGLHSAGGMLLPSSRLGPDCNQLKACRNWGQTNQSRQSSVSLGFFLTYFHLLQLSFFSFASTITDICSLGAFQLFFFFSMRSHQDVECPTLGSFQPSEFNICLCQRENGAFSHRYFRFHWWKQSFWFLGKCGIFYCNSWYSWRKRQTFGHRAPVKDELVRKTFSHHLIHIK